MEEDFSHSLMVLFKLYTYKNILLVFCQGQMMQLQKRDSRFACLKKSVYSNSANTVRFYFSELNYYTLSDRGVFQAPFLGVFIHFGWNKVSKTKGQVACGSEGLISVPKNSPRGFPSAYRHWLWVSNSKYLKDYFCHQWKKGSYNFKECSDSLWRQTRLLRWPVD